MKSLVILAMAIIGLEAATIPILIPLLLEIPEAPEVELRSPYSQPRHQHFHQPDYSLPS